MPAQQASCTPDRASNELAELRGGAIGLQANAYARAQQPRRAKSWSGSPADHVLAIKKVFASDIRLNRSCDVEAEHGIRSKVAGEDELVEIVFELASVIAADNRPGPTSTIVCNGFADNVARDLRDTQAEQGRFERAGNGG